MGQLRGSTVLLSGEAGIGKSRLAALAKEFLAARGFTILQGNFFEQDRTLPYAGLLDLIRRHLVTLPRPEAAALVAGVPELSRLLPDIDSLWPEALPLPDLDGAEQKRRLLGAFSRFVENVGAGLPAGLILEDLHWADAASLEVILHLALLTSSRPILLILTFRSDEVDAALAHLLAGLERERLATEVRLDRLALLEVDAMLRAMLQGNRFVRADVLLQLHTLTDGNPFFVEEVTRSLTEDGAQPVREAL